MKEEGKKGEQCAPWRECLPSTGPVSLDTLLANELSSEWKCHVLQYRQNIALKMVA